MVLCTTSETTHHYIVAPDLKAAEVVAVVWAASQAVDTYCSDVVPSPPVAVSTSIGLGVAFTTDFR
jgi:hypothetical protein